MTNIALIGCTGSIGRQAADVVRRYPDRFRFTALACASRAEELSALCREFSPRLAYCEAPFIPPAGVKTVGDRAELLEPQELRERLGELAGTLARRYRKGD